MLTYLPFSFSWSSFGYMYVFYSLLGCLSMLICWKKRQMVRLINKWYIYNSMRYVNVTVNVFGAIMIMYSLWLLNVWFHIPCPLPKPCFILVCLGVGIAVCLITLSGYIVSHYLTKYILAIYIILMLCLLAVQAAIIITMYFKINWELNIEEYIDDQHKQFKAFIFFHLVICRLMTLFVLAAQGAIVLLAIILWTVGADGMICCNSLHPTDFHQSFLEYNSRPIIDPDQLEGNFIQPTTTL